MTQIPSDHGLCMTKALIFMTQVKFDHVCKVDEYLRTTH